MTHTKTSRCVFLAATTFLVVASASAVDDSVWINQEIVNAIQSGQTEYRIPAGTYTIENPIIIPDGTSNFTLRGAGMDETTITTPNAKLGSAITIGLVTMCHNNWGLTNRQNSLVANIQTGASTLQLLSGQTPPVPGYYVLWDNYTVMRISGDNGSMNHAEVVKVLSYDPTTRIVQLDHPVGREYTYSPRLADVRSVICSNVGISDIGFDGVTSTGDATTSFVSTGIADGLYIARLAASNYITNAITTNLGRNVLIENTQVRTARAGGPGAGYGVGVYRSRFVTVRNCYDEESRHGFIVHSGSMDVTFDSCNSVGGGFDTHGYDERRIQFLNCSGTGVNIANAAYLGGAKDILVDNCDFKSWWVSVGPNSRNINVRNTQMMGAAFAYVKNGSTQGTPSGGFVDSVLFENCIIKGNDGNGLLRDCSYIGSVTFVKCTLDYQGSLGHLWRANSWTKASFNFYNCIFKTIGGGKIMEIACPGPSFNLSVMNCQFQNLSTQQWVPYFVELGTTFGGRLNFRNNQYYMATNPKPNFIYDPARRFLGSSSGNKLVPASALK